MTINEGDWSEISEAILCQLDPKKGFLQGARLAIQVGDQVLRAADLGSFRDRLSDRGIILWAILSNSAVTEKNAQALGLATKLFVPIKESAPRPGDNYLGGESATIFQRTIRSGEKIINQGHTVIIGDINPGAEVIADGNVVVWGKIRGVVHAGSHGKFDAMICGLELDVAQLRIADLMFDRVEKQTRTGPGTARIKDGIMIIEKWNK
jgi:septum site-determining protein MinC